MGSLATVLLGLGLAAVVFARVGAGLTKGDRRVYRTIGRIGLLLIFLSFLAGLRDFKAGPKNGYNSGKTTRYER